MSVVVIRQFGIEPSINTWTYEIQGDPSALGLAGGIGSRAIQMDSSPPGDIWDKSGPNDTDWTLELSLPAAQPQLTADTVAALVGTSGTPSATNRFVTDGDSRLIGGGGGTGGAGLPSMNVATAPVSGTPLTGDGSTDDAPALSTLANTTMAGAGTVYFTPGKSYRLATAIAIPLGVTLWLPRSAVLQVDAVQVVISGTIDAGPWPVFNCVNGGTVVFSATNNKASSALVLGNTEIYPQWWGATGNGGTDDTAAINACVAATTGLPLTPSTTRRNAGPAIRFPAGKYRITDAIQATDVDGLRFVGSGRDNTTIAIDDNWSGTSHAVTAATTTTVSCAGTPFTASHFNTGRWSVYISSGTGAGQWAIVSDNTTSQITITTIWPVTPDTTSVFFVVPTCALDLDGVFAFSGSDFTVTATNAQMRHGIKYYRNADLSAGGSSQGRFTNVTVNRNYLDSGFRCGSKDTARETNWQSDLCTFVGCSAIGNGSATLAQRGFSLGDGSFDNVLNYTLLGCESISNNHNVFVSATNVAIYGGTYQSAVLADFCVNNGVQGYFTANGFRSEGSRMLFDSISSQSFPFAVSLRDFDFFTDSVTGNRWISLCLGGTALTVENARWVPDVLTSGTATGGTSTTLTDTSATFNTATVTYFDGGTAVGHAGHQLYIRAGTGAGQRRTITSNTSTTFTVPAWDVTPDATSTYEIVPAQQIYVSGQGSGAHLDLHHVLMPLPVHQFIAQGVGVWTAELHDCAELDRDANEIFGSAVRQAGVMYLSAGPTHPITQSWTNPLSIGSPPDAYLSRTAAGYVTSPNFQTTNLVVAPVGTTGIGSAQKAGAHSGTTQFNYKLVAVDGLGNKALPSSIFSTPATCSATLSLDGAWILIIPNGGTLPPNCATIDVLKDNGSGTYGKIGTVAAYRFGEFVDYGQPIVTYTTPSADATGNASFGGNVTVTGTVNSTTISTSTIPTSSQLSGLTGGGDTSLHFHSADRARSNHTGTQALSTITGGTATGSGYVLPDLTVSGLITANGGISGTLAQTTITANYTVLTTDQIILADATAGNIVVTLPAASAEGAREVAVKKIDSSANTVRVAAAGTDTIDGAASVTLSSQYAWIDITADGTSKWNILSASTTAVSVAASSVTPGTFAAGAYTFTAALTANGTTTFGGSGTVAMNGNAYFNQQLTQRFFNAGNSGTALTISSSNGNFQKTTLTGNCTLTISAPGNAWPLKLWLIQDATGSRTVTWPASVKWAGGSAPTLTTTASKTDIVVLTWDGSATFYGTIWGQNF